MYFVGVSLTTLLLPTFVSMAFESVKLELKFWFVLAQFDTISLFVLVWLW